MYELDYINSTQTTTTTTSNTTNDDNTEITTIDDNNNDMKMRIKRKLNEQIQTTGNTNPTTTTKRIRRNSCGSTDSNYSIESNLTTDSSISSTTTTIESPQQQQTYTTTDTTSPIIITKKENSTSIDNELLGPCKSGSPIQLQGIVWSETNRGVLVLNVTWKGKTFIGALMDSTNHSWAPPVFNNQHNIKLAHNTDNHHNKLYSSSASTSSSCTLDDQFDEQFAISQDPSIRILRNGKRRYLNLANKLASTTTTTTAVVNNKNNKKKVKRNKDKANNISKTKSTST